MWCKLSDFRPHSSPDPLTRATLPPGEGIFPDACGIGGNGTEAVPYGFHRTFPHDRRGDSRIARRTQKNTKSCKKDPVQPDGVF